MGRSSPRTEIPGKCCETSSRLPSRSGASTIQWAGRSSLRHSILVFGTYELCLDALTSVSFNGHRTYCNPHSLDDECSQCAFSLSYCEPIDESGCPDLVGFSDERFTCLGNDGFSYK